MIIISEGLTSLIHYIFLASLFLNAFFYLPQAIKILRRKDSKGLSLSMFLGFHFCQVFTILHGYLMKDYLLMIGFLLIFLSCSVVTCLIIFYRIKERNDMSCALQKKSQKLEE